MDRFPDIRRPTASCGAEGVGEIYVAGIESFQNAVEAEPPSEYGCDVGVEFPPHASASPTPGPGELLNPDFAGWSAIAGISC